MLSVHRTFFAQENISTRINGQINTKIKRKKKYGCHENSTINTLGWSVSIQNPSYSRYKISVASKHFEKNLIFT